jgi:gliding motility-associated-like protein
MRFYFLVVLIVPYSLFSQITFSPFVTTATGSWPEVVAVGDINKDGLNDVVLATASYFDPINDYKIFVFLQDVSGNLQAPIKYPYSNSTEVSAISIADLNNDSRNDVVVGFGDSIGIFFQNSGGAFNPITRYYSGQTIVALKTGDLNNDGLQDIATAHLYSDSMTVFYQKILGFTTSTYISSYGNPPPFTEIDIGDINSDGLQDVVYTTDYSPNQIYVYTQNVSGLLNSYSTYSISVAPFVSLPGIAIGDLDNDGKNDIAGSGYANSPNARLIIWFQNQSTYLLNPPLQMPASDLPEPIEIADLNCNGRNEIIMVHAGWQKVTVFEQTSSGQYGSYNGFSLPYASHYNSEGLAIGDINNDGKKDIVIADYNNGLVVLLNTSSIDPISVTSSGSNNICIGSSETLTASGASNYLWTPISGLSSISGANTIVTPTITTTYTVTSIGNCGNISSTITVTVYPFPVASIIPVNNICAGTTTSLAATGGISYLWSNGAASSSICISPTTNTTYSVYVSNGFCTDDTSITLIVTPNPIATISSSIIIFPGQVATLGATGGENYLWSNGETTDSIMVSPAITTIYCVTVTDANNCNDTACVRVDVKSPCDTAGTFFLPNAFSPNGDGENDFLQIYYRNMDCIRSLHLSIYDRWGEKVYETSDPNFQWDGKYRGETENTKVLTYSLFVQFTDDKQMDRKGNVSLVK